ncbi:MAG: carbon starvation CstA family protein, partial [Planctomycetota bacterium]
AIDSPEAGPEHAAAMSLPLLASLVLGLLALGYTFYGRFVARQLSLDDARKTPAEAVNDGVDFVPTRPFYLFGQHFSAIAAAGPIAGPILACQAFGWLPCILWIGLGVIFIGAVHDLTALFASVRHNARSIAEIVKENVGPRAWKAILAFIWLALVYVILAFADVTAITFLGETDEASGVDKGGAVAAASTVYLLLAVAMGIVQRRFAPPLWLLTSIFVPATLGAVWLGTEVSTLLLFSHRTWAVAIMAYCFLASLTPCWTLLQPRGYLGGFVLYIALAVGVAGIFFGGFPIHQPATTEAPLFGLGKSVFPFLFVTIACGACSGFHGLVCSGTTSKQIARESHCRAVGYGAMLLEGFVALIALATVMILTADEAKAKAPGVIYGEGLARFLTVLIGKELLVFAATFGKMAFSTFVFDTLDVATRLGRYILQELAGARGRASAVTATALTAGVPLLILLATGKGGYQTFWTLFGTSNQLLAALTLLGISVWLRRTGRRCWFTILPMLFVMAITLWSLAGQLLAFAGNLRHPETGALLVANAANGAVAVLLFLLTGLLAFDSSRALLRVRAG